jgi:DNA-binding response OmpR family regulator
MPPPDEQRTEDTAAETTGASGPDLSHLSILVVGANMETRGIISSMLMNLKVTRIREASTVSAAYAMLQEYPPDLIIADYETRPTNGIDFVRWVRNGSDSPYPKVPVILVSGRTDAESVRMARDSGIDEFIALPFSFNVLFERIHAVTGGVRGFVESRNYVGPDRRRRDRPIQGSERRK